MKKLSLTLIVAAIAALAFGLTADRAAAHCEVPCGIYGDPARFDAMLEDTQTIEKAMGQIQELAAKGDAQSANQLVRWVTTKEEHAERIQETISRYFMAQRIKADDPAYTTKLTRAHAVIVAAMKCKQNVDPAVAGELRKAIRAFHDAYEAEPEAS